MIVSVPLPEYKPDQSNNSGVLLVAENVYPAQDGYRSVGDIFTISDALTGDFQGGASAIASDGDAYLLAGTGTNLYKLGAAGAWSSLVGSLTITGRWRFAQFKDYVISVNGDTTREVDLDAGTASALSGAPTGTSIAVVGDFVVIGQANGDISMVRWSAFDDHTGWTIGTNQSGEQPMQTGGAVMYVAGGEYGVILQRERIVRMTRTGSDATPFQFDEISSNYGCAAGGTVAQAGRSIFFRSDRGFVALDDGQALRPIGSEKVDRAFNALVSRDALESIYTVVDPQNNLVMWVVPGTPGTIWVYNFELDRWSTIEVNCRGAMAGFTISLGIDDIAALYAPDGIDDIGLTVDDPRWSGGNPRLYLVNSENKIGTLAGDNLAAQLDLGFMEFTKGRRARVRGVRPVTDATGGMSLSLLGKARLGDTGASATGSTLRPSGKMPVRVSGRYVSVSLRIAAGQDWDYVQGLEVECEAGGER